MWKSVVDLTSGARIGLAESFIHTTLVNLGKYFPGKIWGILARGWRLSERHDASPADILRTTYIEQYYLFLCAGVVSAILAAALFPSLLLIVGAALGIIFVAVSPYVHRHFARVFVWLLSRLQRTAGSPDAKWSDAPMRQRDNVFLFAGFFCMWLLSGVFFYAVYLSIFPGTPAADEFALMTLANTVAIVAGFVAVFAPGGIGVREGVSAAILSARMPIADALMLGVVFRIWVVAFEILAGVLAFAVTRRLAAKERSA
jgi:uncharacterized membrane protein YbhN (UPF0104 family)